MKSTSSVSWAKDIPEVEDTDEAPKAPATEQSVAPVAPGDGTTFSYEVLKSSCPAGVEPHQKEQYLSDTEFTNVFGMDKAAFNGMAKWKQQQAKKKVGLF